jgi:hypothetical protein
MELEIDEGLKEIAETEVIAGAGADESGGVKVWIMEYLLFSSSHTLRRPSTPPVTNLVVVFDGGGVEELEISFEMMGTTTLMIPS